MRIGAGLLSSIQKSTIEDLPPNSIVVYLHIPLSRTNQTTRRSRWVVWFTGALMLGGFFLGMSLINLSLTRNTVFAAAPEATTTAIQILINNKTWPILQTILGETTLISNRSLTVNDLVPFVDGEVGWFFHDDGSNSVAIRSQKEKIPNELLEALQIVRQDVRPGLFLLSEKLQPLSGIRPRSVKKGIPTFSGTKLGMFYSKETGVSTEIRGDGRGISFSLAIDAPTSGNNISIKKIPEDTTLILSTPVLSNETMHRVSFSNIIDPFFHQSITIFLSKLLQNKGVIIQTNDENQSFLLFSEEDKGDLDRMRLLQTLIAMKNPTLQKTTIADRTSVYEIVADPSLISVEERTIAGSSYYKASDGDRTLFLSKEGRFVLSNSEQLIRFWSEDNGTNNVSLNCNTNVGLIDTKELFNRSSAWQSYTPSVLRSVFSKFHYVALFEKRGILHFSACL